MGLVLACSLGACQAITRGKSPDAAPSPSPGATAQEAGEVRLVQDGPEPLPAPTAGPFDRPPEALALALGMRPEVLATGPWTLSPRLRAFRATSIEAEGLALRGCYYQDVDGDGLPEAGERGALFFGVEGASSLEVSAASKDARMELFATAPVAVKPQPLALAGPFPVKFSASPEASTPLALAITLRAPAGPSWTREVAVPLEAPATRLVARRCWAQPLALGFGIALELHNPSEDLAPAGLLRVAGGNPSSLAVPTLGPGQAHRMPPFLLRPTPAAQVAGAADFAFELSLGGGPPRPLPVRLPAPQP